MYGCVCYYDLPFRLALTYQVDQLLREKIQCMNLRYVHTYMHAQTYQTQYTTRMILLWCTVYIQLWCQNYNYFHF